MEHSVTRKGRYKVENYSEHNTVEEAIQAATNKSIELGRIVSIIPPSYEVVVMGIAENTGQNIGENTGISGSIPIIAPPSGELEVNRLFVDNTLSASITNGTYSIANRDNSGTDGNAYTTIQAAINAMVSGDTIYIRGGTYYENVLISGSTVPNGTINDYCELMSYPNEWAIIDGQNLQQYTIGKNRSGRDITNDIQYWKFERLEITGGTNGVDSGGGGLVISGGPFTVRLCYIHDNYQSSDPQGNNPAGLVGYCWNQCTIEFNHFKDNGLITGTDNNGANIAVFGDYASDFGSNATNGFDGIATDATNRNNIQYNLIDGAVIGFKHKGAQLLTGRDTGNSDYSDTYSDWGDNIHHNYFVNQLRNSMIVEQDFCQVHHNIFDTSPEAIAVDAQPDFQLYRVTIYNNTFYDPTYKAIVRYGCEYFSFTENESHYGHDLNNIIYSHGEADAWWFNGTAINVLCGCSPARNPAYTSPDFSNYICSHNYFYDPDNGLSATLFAQGSPITEYNQNQFEAQTITGAPRVIYFALYNAGDPLFVGTTGSDKFLTYGTHTIESGVTVADGGSGGAHPYLTGITIPSYVGATNPVSNAWVSGILNNITDVTWLQSQTSGNDPTWVE